MDGPTSMGLSAGLEIGQGIVENMGYREQARRLEENARLDELQGAYNETAIRHQERAVSGEAIVAQADNGVAIGTGSALDLLHQNAFNREMAVLNARYAAQGEAYANRVKAEDARSAGKRAIIGSVIKVGTQILTETRSDARTSKILAAQNNFPGSMQLPGTGSGSTAGVYAPRSVFPY